jgi:hypothetical protein
MITVREGKPTKPERGTMMKKLNVNSWMEMDMIGYLFFAVYAEGKNEWWILAKCDTFEEAAAAAEMESAEGGEGEYFVINLEGKRVKG